jgi:hypothetical protein
VTAAASWRHTDPRGPLVRAVTEALGRAARLEWNADASALSSSTRAADLRALVLATAFVSMRLSTVREVMSAGDATMTIPVVGTYSTDERRNAAGALWATWSLLSDNPQPAAARIATNGDGAATNEAGNPLLAAVAIVVGAVVAVAVGVYVVQKAAEVVDRQLARREETQRLIASQGSALKLLAMHAKLEEAAGRELPLTDAERQELANLQAIQNAIAGKSETGLPSPIPKGSDIGQGLGFGAVLAAIAAWFLLAEKEPGR